MIEDLLEPRHLELLVFLALLGLVPASIARSKGRSFFLWWVYGAALFIVALPHALIMKTAAYREL
jgi:hypothetical protein